MGKKKLIVSAAIDSFLEKGIHKTTISDIVREAGIAQGTFYLYFTSKWALMPAIAEVMAGKILQTMKESVDEQASYDTQLKQMIAAVFEVNRVYHEVQAIVYAGVASTEHIKEWETVYAPIYDYVSSWLTEAKEEGEVRDDIQPEKISKLMIGLIEATAEQIYLYDTDKEAEAIVQQEEVYQFLQHALQ
ncbi:TetR family transcriptional regulator [Planococcaceae bacterium Storch 2/2-2]|nr:TetR family transcriptional regulator [Planococcaceae bacterium Storch 2/2-2]